MSWLSQVSFEPPMIMFSVDKKHYSEELLRSTRTFVVNVLAENQVKLAGHFAKQAMAGEDKLASVATREADSGARILTDALAWLDCEVVALHPTGDHFMVVGKVIAAGVQHRGPALTTASGMRYRESKP
ncbi:MAG: flavin reductase [Deltaproteobacteria bacterium]|nr:flavin reductase [Deltaproteobacteria bacterium]